MTLIWLFLTLTAASAESANRALTSADYFEFEEVSDPQISPDGKRIVYTRRWIDSVGDKWNSSIWIINTDGSRNRFLLEGSNPRWSPQGDRILFIRPDAYKKPQIHTRWMDDEGAVSQVTRGDLVPRSPVWSPDGTTIAFVAVVPINDDWKINLPSPPKDALWTKPPRILDRLHYRQDGVGFSTIGFSHLFVVPADSGSARQLTSGDWHVGAQFDGLFSGADLNWTPDGRHIVFDGWKEPNGDLSYRRSHIYALDVSSLEVSRLTQTTGFWTEPEISPDGKSIAYIGYPATEKTYEMPRVHIMRIDGSGAFQVSDTFDRPPSQLLWDSNSQGLYFTAEDVGYVHIFYQSLAGNLRRITDGAQIASLNSIDAKRRIGVGVRSDAASPGDVHLIRLSGSPELKRLTEINADLLSGKTLGEQEEIWFTASDGNRAHGWLIKPPNFDAKKRYPMIMEIHGGPFAMYRGTFNFMYQLFAANGYVVLYTNPRGSTGYGEAFSQGIDRAYPSVDYLDLMAAVDAAVAKGYVDGNRLYVGGCSGGGVLSSWMISHTDRFAAAAVRCPVTNWLSMAGTTDIPGFTHSFFDKPFWEDPTNWLNHSPLMHVGKVNTPTIVMTGELDARTPMAQSEEYYAALKMRGVPSKLVRFHDEFHGTGSKPSNWLRTTLYMMDWYKRWDRSKPRDASNNSAPNGTQEP